jgi:hypothetical protein
MSDKLLRADEVLAEIANVCGVLQEAQSALSVADGARVETALVAIAEINNRLRALPPASPDGEVERRLKWRANLLEGAVRTAIGQGSNGPARDTLLDALEHMDKPFDSTTPEGGDDGR